MSVMNEGIGRRRLMTGVALLAAPAILPRRVWAEENMVELQSPSGNSLRHVSSAFPEKGPMIVHRTRPAWLEPRFETFDKGVFTTTISITSAGTIRPFRPRSTPTNSPWPCAAMSTRL